MTLLHAARHMTRTSHPSGSRLQLAARLGDKRMVQYILRCQSVCMWVWGPVSEYHLDLRGIDSAGGSVRRNRRA